MQGNPKPKKVKCTQARGENQRFLPQQHRSALMNQPSISLAVCNSFWQIGPLDRLVLS